MFGKKPSANISDTVETIIGPSVKIEGDFIGEGDIIVEGKIVGNLQTNQNLRIGPQAIVEAEVRAANAYIAGTVTGNVLINDVLEIASGAQINGDITCGTISIEAGGKINGQLLMKANNQNSATKGKKIIVDSAKTGQEEL